MIAAVLIGVYESNRLSRCGVFCSFRSVERLCCFEATSLAVTLPEMVSCWVITVVCATAINAYTFSSTRQLTNNQQYRLPLSSKNRDRFSKLFDSSEKSKDWLRVSGGLPTKKDERQTKDVESATRKKAKDPKQFSRTNRIEGQEKWIKELFLYCEEKNRNENIDQSLAAVPKYNVTASPVLIIELAKELLYSGIPEQVLELYAAYCDIVVTPDSSFQVASSTARRVNLVAPDTKLILVATRAFIAMADIKGALKLLQATSRSALDFDADSKSLLMADLAECSPEGLQAALKLHKNMSERKERVSGVGYAGILRGIWMYGMSSRPKDKKLLLEREEEEQQLLTEQGNSFRLSADKAESLTLDLINEYVAQYETAETGHKKTHRVMNEAIRVLFKAATTRTRGSYDRNFESDVYSDREQKAKAGLKYALQFMTTYKLKFDVQIADVLIAECMLLGDVSGVKFVVQKMWASGLCARTSTFNVLLKRYADNGDGESAYTLVRSVMEGNEETMPNSDTYALLLESCLRTQKGRYYALQIIQARKASGEMRKAEWDRLMELNIMRNDHTSLFVVLKEMVLSGNQPDDHTIMLLMEAYRRTGNREGALKLHKLQVQSETSRRRFRKNALKVGVNKYVEPSRDTVSEAESLKSVTASDSGSSIELTEELGMYLPPPTRRTVHCLLEILRDAAAAEEALAVLDDMCDRARETEAAVDSKPAFSALPEALPLTLTQSGRFLLGAQYAPSKSTFALVIEACVKAGNADLALTTFSRMERWGLYPDRRVYAALISAFGVRKDVSSALGVFDEMRRAFAPDVATLQSILDVCMLDPLNLRQLCVVLEGMAEDGLTNLEVYSKDILMVTFPDAVELGRALEGMEMQLVPVGFECATASLAVIAVLVQASRKKAGVDAIVAAMEFLGQCGIRPDAETMEYFRIPDAPVLNSPNSRMHTKLKVKKERVRSLMDLDMPAEYAPDMEVPLPLPFMHDSKKGAVVEPYFEAGQDDWAMHSKILQKAMTGAENEGDDNEIYELDSDGQVLDVERLLLEGAFDAPESDGEDADLEDDWSASAGATILYNIGGSGPFAGELGDYEELLAFNTERKNDGRSVTLRPLEIKESFLGQAKPRAAREGGLNPNSSNNPTERKKRGNRGEGQIIKEGENSALVGRSKKNDGSKKGARTNSGAPSSKAGGTGTGGKSKAKEGRSVERSKSPSR